MEREIRSEKQWVRGRQTVREGREGAGRRWRGIAEA